MFRLWSNPSERFQFELAPLIDLVFLLLIFFLLTSLFVEPRLEVDLPGAAHAQPGEEEVVILVISQDEQITLNGRPVTPGALDKALKEAIDIEGTRRLLIRADRRVPFQAFVRVLDAARGLDLQEIAIATLPEEG